MTRHRFKALIIFENDNYLAINKPAGISSLHERVQDGQSIIEWAQAYDPDLQLCHRLDKETSGVLLLSKNHDAYVNASVQFEKRKVEKHYHAIVDGFHSFKDLMIDLPLATTRSAKSAVNYSKGKPSQTLVNTIKNFEHFSLVDAQPISGRLHQIRAHLAAQQAPITADSGYGGHLPKLSQIKRKFNLAKNKEEKPMIERVALHARSLAFADLDGSPIRIEANYPKDFSVLLKLLEKYDASNISS